MEKWIRMYAPGGTTTGGGGSTGGSTRDDEDRDNALESGATGDETDAALGGLTDGGDADINTSGAMGVTSEDYDKTS